MRARGITYDTGFTPGGRSSRPVFDSDAVKREMRVIAEDLHCDAVRITGGDPERLAVAARHAADAGLEVWFSPFPCELTAQELLPYFADCAERAQEVGADVIVTGCELSLFAAGFLPGNDSLARIRAVADETPEASEASARIAEIAAKLDAVLPDIVATVRERFHGKVTYAAGTWEQIDWTPFDIVSVDAYGDTSDAFRQGVREHLRHGKPLAATEFGCCTYRGAAERGGAGWAIVDHEADPPRLDGDYVRDEDEQANHLREMIAVFDEEGVDTAFWFTFAGYEFPHHSDPRFDLDMASYGVCKLMPDGSLAPKRSFHAMAETYR
ncbi:hypothetical protein [Streptoalloteichus hindustanus]|uniref:Abortive infection protein n=1 Tax=Streptoalloteichus hindustanus TaxID=2017 RepID=A0A1M5IEQ4_STRHI|nr:hypothetical protein [Streptoalloteichus hindustanus]SHG26745.1 hypothetical protein SAMN05444320_107250 [Streptoalloteichus hindustanus]